MGWDAPDCNSIRFDCHRTRSDGDCALVSAPSYALVFEFIMLIDSILRSRMAVETGCHGSALAHSIPVSYNNRRHQPGDVELATFPPYDEGKTMASAPSPAVPPLWPSRAAKRLFVGNLVAILSTGILVSVWLMRFTDWFESFASLLALGSAFTWLAFVFHAGPEGPLKSLRDEVVTGILKSHRTWRYFLCILGVLLVLSLFLGSLQVEGRKTGFDARIQAFREGNHPDDRDSEYLPAQGHVRTLWWTWPWSRREVRVKATDLPEGKALVKPVFWSWRATPCVVPTDLYRPVVIIGASAFLTNLSLNSDDKIRLVVKMGDTNYSTAFDGHAVWIGCRTGDLDVPPEVRAVWGKNLEDPNAGPLLLSPQHRDCWPAEVAPGDRVEAYLENADENKRISKIHLLVLRKPASMAEVVQPLLLEGD